MSETRPTTLADRPQMMRALAVHPNDFDAACAQTEVWAPCCGRRTAAFTVVSLHGLTTVIRGGNHRPARNHDWACDGCLHLLILDESNDWTWSRLYRALGAPADIIRHYRAKEIASDEETSAHAAERDLPIEQRRGFNPQDAFEKAFASLPSGVREIPGTETPDV